MNIENLDSLDSDELAALQLTYKLLARYCRFKQRAMRCRIKGFIPQAIELELTCQAIYDLLPKEDRW